MSGSHRVRIGGGAKPGKVSLGEVGFTVCVVAATAALITAASVVTGALYHLIAYGRVGPLWNCASLGLLIATLYLLQLVSRNRFAADEMLRRRVRDLGPEIAAWCLAFVALLVMAFLTKTTAIHSRGWLLSFFTFGLALIPAMAATSRRAVAILMRTGRLMPRTVVVVGYAGQISGAIARLEARGLGTKVVGVAEFAPSAAGKSRPDQPDDWDEVLDRTAAAARKLGADDIVIAIPLEEVALIDRSIAAFSMLPVGVHLDAGSLHDRFGTFRLERVGRLPCLALIEPPMRPFNATMKRLLDVAIATMALIVLSPLLVMIALAIKLDSPGPVLFRQRRVGFNQREFRIFKFRSMSTMDDGDKVEQATRGDARVTRVGRLLRRTNLDELPQLLNVLRGEMSVVGPRPHAVAHDRLYEQRIGAYARRLNVKPGITGWAQIHGLRGATETDDKMARRVEHDLYYIDNWSLGLDLYIVAMTIFSRRTFQNAY